MLMVERIVRGRLDLVVATVAQVFWGGGAYKIKFWHLHDQRISWTTKIRMIILKYWTILKEGIEIVHL